MVIVTSIAVTINSVCVCNYAKYGELVVLFAVVVALVAVVIVVRVVR